MSKARHRKDHKKKVAARNKKIQEQKNSIKKYQQSMLEQLIEIERKKGAFGGTNSNIPGDTAIDDIILNGPELG